MKIRRLRKMKRVEEKTEKLKEYYFYEGGYKENSFEVIQHFNLDYKFKVGSISVEICYSPKFQDENRKKRINEYLEGYIKEKRGVEDAMINISMLQNVKVAYSIVCCKNLRLFIRTP